MDAFHDLALLELGLGHAADAHRAEVCVTCLNATQATKVFVPLRENKENEKPWIWI